MADKLNKKYNVRKILKTVIENAIKEIDELMKETPNDEIVEKIQSSQEVLKRKVAAVKTLEDEILDITDDIADLERVVTESTTFEINCEMKVSSIVKYLNKHRKTEEKRSNVKSKETVRLPKLEITKFDGDPTKWQTFIDSFDTAIERSTTLSGIEKFNYLRCFLDGDALHTISGLSLTNDNYKEALKLLKSRYGNTQLIVSAHMNALVKLPNVSNEDLTSLRKFYDDVESHVRSLRNLGIESKSYGSLLSTLVIEKLPQELKLIVSRNIKENIWDLTKVLDIINLELRARETCTIPHQMSTDGKSDDNLDGLFTGSSLHAGTVRSSSHFGSGQQTSNKCVFCKGSHWSDKCRIISDAEARKEFLKKERRCFLCLKLDHMSRSCQKSKPCFYCKGMHNSAICNNKNKRDKIPNSNTSTNYASNFSSILLPTADILLENPLTEKCVKVKVLFDQGSQRTYVTQRVKNILSLAPICTENISISTFGNKKCESTKLERVSLNLKNSKEKFEVEALCTPFICLPIKKQSTEFAKSNCDFLKDVELADSRSTDEVDLLVGSDFYWLLVTGNVKFGKPGEPVGVETKFGWVLNGPVDGGKEDTGNVNFVSELSNHVLFINSEPNSELAKLESKLDRFWDLETIGISEFEKHSHDQFIDSIYVNEEKRYETRLPFKETHPLLHDHFDLCAKRLEGLHTKLKQDPDLLKKYNDIFISQRELGIIEEAPENCELGECHYIPHHPVVKENKDTSKVRIVFDASAKSEGPSLNECLYKGPQLTPLIFDIFLRFRTFLVALTSDIEKAFLQISIDKGDRDYLRFLWFDDVFSDTPKIIRNRFARVIFGVTSSPFLLNGTIRKHMENYEFDEEFLKKVFESFYVDDFSGGENSFEKAFDLFKRLKIRFLEGLFYLRKWRTNNAELRKLISDSSEGEVKPSKILGIIWDEIEDSVIFDLREICDHAKTLTATKRNILKILAMFYDPIGFLQPLIINLKIIFQRICKLKLNWDDEIPVELKGEWISILRCLEELGEIKLPRKMIEQDPKDPLMTIELHGFSDASFQNYGACVYIRTVSKSNKIDVNLVAAKSRLAPMKPSTIPRLELLGNLLLSRLMNSVENSLSKVLNISGKYYWTDSQITLAWISSHNKEFKTFVENRVQEIRKNTHSQDWQYCETKSNPADLLTRFKNLENFQDCKMWWEGPNFLKKCDIPRFSNTSSNRDENFEIELKTSSLLIQNNEPIEFDLENIIDLEKYSSLLKLKRITAWMYRFVNNLKGRLHKGEPLLTPFLKASELRTAEQNWLKQNQKSFDDAKLKTLSKDLNLIYDKNELIRCEGRLKHAPLPYDARTPVLVNSQHHLAKLIVNHFHRSFKHITLKQTLSELRQKFWICKGRNFVRNILRKCSLCRKYEGQPFRYPVAPALTKLRLHDKFSFYTTGIDNFGPLYVKNVFNSKTDDSTLFKTWVTLYTCAASRAIILDLTPHLDSHSFIRSFRRFIGRRGCPSNVISDGGKNFVSEETQTFVHSLGVEWNVNLPLAPWHGGFFERLVRSTKTLLRKELQACKLNYEELQTIILEVEAILNNRPLTYYYDDDTESCLTPNHLLFGRQLNMFNPEPFEISHTPIDINVHSKKLNNILEHFWERWKKEYLVNLREYHKAKLQKLNRPLINMRDVVIVEEEKLPRSLWRTGIVEELLQGKDGEIRGAAVRIPKTNSILKRPVNRLYLVESMNDNVEQDNNITDNLEEAVNSRPKRQAAITGEIRRKFNDF